MVILSAVPGTRKASYILSQKRPTLFSFGCDNVTSGVTQWQRGQECLVQAARAVYGPAKDAPVDAFVLQLLSSIEGLDAAPRLWIVPKTKTK